MSDWRDDCDDWKTRGPDEAEEEGETYGRICAWTGLYLHRGV